MGVKFRRPYRLRTGTIKQNSLAFVTLYAAALMLSLIAIWQKPSVGHRTLVVHTSARQSELAEAESNFDFFSQRGVCTTNGAHDFYFIVESNIQFAAPKTSCDVKYELYRYRCRENGLSSQRCRDLGSIGWLLFESGKVQLSRYKYFVFVNPSVRGPFVPSYIEKTSWIEVLTGKLTETVKLVGPVISCGGMKWNESVRQNPHVQSYVMATDITGLELLRKNDVFGCYDGYEECVYRGELGASLAILEAGFNLDSLMLRYQGVDWRKKENWKCNDGLSPMLPYLHGGKSLDPMEVMFVDLIDAQDTTISNMLIYSSMSGGELRDCVNCSAMDALKLTPSFVKELYAVFDLSFYRDHSSDLRHYTDSAIWCHFIAHGVREQRSFAITAHSLVIPFTLPYNATNKAVRHAVDKALKEQQLNQGVFGTLAARKPPNCAAV